MIIPAKNRIEIDLGSTDGNAFALIGRAGSYAEQLCLDADIIVTELMQSGNYQNLINVFDNYFGGIVDLIEVR